MTNCTCNRFYQVRRPDEIFFPLQLLQLEEATPSTTHRGDHHCGGPLRLPGGRKDALREGQAQKRAPQREANALCIEGKALPLRFPLRSYVVALGFTK
ncbi:hypothetical protein TNCT_672781 [Trichonephila clavata]|uniref:Uncharacterized protein n=1 Tax=Trichonephila clavata TaxID=2740835 RepID=A0A8X6LCV8_TRICU|nr:hypothetical protein TNCT_672781 [Trichonephila clavata]